MSLAGKTNAITSSALAANQNLKRKIRHVRCDITTLCVDAIVNAANARLLGGGGVDGAIHRAAGNGLYQECRRLDGCSTGSAKITGAYNLPCKKVIHAVGPIYHSRQRSEPLLRGCYRTSLELAVQNQCKSIAFSAISTGIYGYPSADAADAAISEVKSFLTGPDGDRIEQVIFCSFEPKDVVAYDETIPKYFPTEDDQAGEASSPEPTKTEPSESLAATPSRPPTTGPRLSEQPIAKKQKVETSHNEDKGEVEVLTDQEPRGDKSPATPGQNSEEEWEKIAKDDLSDSEPASKLS